MVGFIYIGVPMNELVSAAATIQGAQIQANYALWAAVVSAFIGAIGIVFAAWYAWQSGMKLHQYNNIIAAKRDVYLDAIAKYQQIKNDLKLITVKTDDFNEILLNDRKDFLISISKVQIICDTCNKDIILDFKNNVEDRLKKILSISDIYIKDYFLLLKNKDELSSLEEEQGKLQKDTDHMIVFHADNHRKAILLSNKVEKCKRNLEIVKMGHDYHLELIHKNVEDFEKELEAEYFTFSRILRDELHQKISK